MRRSLILLLPLLACRAEPPASGAAATSPRALHPFTSTGPTGAPSLLWAAGRIAPDADTPEAAARAHLSRLARRDGLGPRAVEQADLRSVHRIGGAVIVQLFRRHDGLEVVPGEVRVLMRGDLSLIAVSGALPGRVAPAKDDAWTLDPEGAVALAATHTLGRRVEPSELRPARTTEDAVYFEAAGPSVLALPTPARARRVLFVKGDLPRYAYLVEGYFGTLEHPEALARRTVVAARDGALLEVRDLTADADFTYRVWAENTGDLRPLDGPVGDISPHPTGVPDGFVPAFVPSRLVQVEAFNTNLLGGSDPWLDPSAQSTSGNNADAYADHNGPDGFSSGDLRASTTGPRAFEHAYDPTRPPAESEAQIMASVTQLFYTVNWLHDYWYDSGFDESAGNAQRDNYGRGGEGGDPMRAEAQDDLLGGARNNANMSTPGDGVPPRMQVYVWTGLRTARVAASGQDLEAGIASFGPSEFSIAAGLVAADDGVGDGADACEAVTNAIAGQVALVDRGGCTFSTKALNVQDAGAVGMVLANDRGGAPPSMGGTAPRPVTIGLLSVRQVDGAQLRSALAAGAVPVLLERIEAPDIDASFDSSLVAHEWGHYLHHRLAECGNPQCRGMSEGWGDFLGLHTQLREGDDLVTGTYASAGYSTLGRPDGSYFGTRRYAYSVDRAKNDLSFRHIADGEPLPAGPTDPSGAPNSQVHNTGEIWATMLFEGYVALQRAAATSTSGRSFAEVRRAMTDYVVGSLMMTPDNATFTEARDAMLAVALASEPGDFALLADAFARRGAGTCATSPDRASEDNRPVVEDDTVRPQVGFGGLEVEVTGFSCDGDDVLDADERGQVRVRVGNVGHATLTGAQVTLTSSTGAFRFGGGGTLGVPPLGPLEQAELSVDVQLGPSVSGPAAQAIVVRLEAPDGCETVVTSTVYVPVDRDERADARLDTVSALGTAWATGGDLPDRVWRREPRGPADGLWRAVDYSTYSDTHLTSPPLEVGTSTSFVVTLEHRYRFEADAPDGSSTNWDGAVIELSPDGGQTWVDVDEWVDPGYRGALTDRSGNPLADRPALVGTSPAWPAFEPLVLDFGAALAGRTVRLRFRVGTDAAVGDHGLELDNLAFSGIRNAPFIRVHPDGTTCPPELIADAGPDARAQAGEAVLLDGSGSSSFHGRPLTYSWRQRSGPEVELERAGAAIAAFTAPSRPTSSALIFELTVNDGDRQATDTVEIDVDAAPLAPVEVDAGEDQAVDPGVEVVLDGSASLAPVDATFAWTQTEGPEVALEGGAGRVARFVAPASDAEATLTFELAVEFMGWRATDEVTVTVRPREPVVADAGPDQAVAAGATVILDGRGSRGPPDARFEWRRRAGPEVAPTPADAPVAAFEAPFEAESSRIELELRVFAGDREDTDTVIVEIAAAPEAPGAPPLEEDGGCRCLGSPGEAPGLLLGLGVFVLYRRRRR